MAAPDYNRAIRTAAELLSYNKVRTPPVSPRELAESVGLDVRYARFNEASEEVCGFIEFANRQITVNANHHTNRQTFTIAHELGHWLLHRELYLQNPGSYKVLLRHPIRKEIDTREREANAFAANLLVPADMLRQYAKYADDTELSALFGVSRDVIGYRRARL